MKLQGKDKIKKVLSSPSIAVYIVESYYGKTESSKAMLGEFYEDEIRASFFLHGISETRIQVKNYGLLISLSSRQEKELLLTEIVKNLTKPTLSPDDLKTHRGMILRGEVR
jgi:hypothetical protein